MGDDTRSHGRSSLTGSVTRRNAVDLYLAPRLGSRKLIPQEQSSDVNPGRAKPRQPMRGWACLLAVAVRPETATYRRYRINVASNSGGQNWCVDELTFLKLPDNYILFFV